MQIQVSVTTVASLCVKSILLVFLSIEPYLPFIAAVAVIT